jgi:hypothetical protein
VYGLFRNGGGATSATAVAQHLWLRDLGLLLSVGWLCVVAACAADRKPTIGGGGAGGQDGAASGVSCWGNTGCDDGDPRSVLSCEPNIKGTVVATCDADQVCSLGHCTTPPCAALRMATTIAGCMFYAAALDNVDSDDTQPTLFVVTNVGDAVAHVWLKRRGVDSDWAPTDLRTIDPGKAQTFTMVADPVQGPGYGSAVARLVVSDAPVTVMIVQSDDDFHAATSSSGTFVLPDHAIGTRYMPVTYNQTATPRMAGMPGARDGAGEIAIVATADHTTLSISPPGAPPGFTPTAVRLMRDGDVYQIVSTDDGDDLSGTLIDSDKPISVFSGNVVTTYGQAGPGINSPDMAMEQMLPISQWSKTYVAARLPPQTDACNSLFPSPDGSARTTTVGTWRVVAEHMANLSFTAPPTVQGLPTESITIPRALSYPLPVTGTGDFIVHSSVPIMVTQGMDCEPSLSSAVPVDAPLGPQLLALAPNFEHVLAIVRKGDRFTAPVTFDDEDIGDDFTLVGDGFWVDRITIPPCYGPIAQCMHRLVGAHGLTLRGMDVACSYAVTVPTWPACRSDSCF